jgi:hypothetical protein
MRWFGYKPFADICRDHHRVETPIGDPCCWCEEPIGPDEDGFLIPVFTTEGVKFLPWHSECNFRQLVGGVNHQRGLCACFGGPLPADPEELSCRDAAILAVDFFVLRVKPS